MKKLPVQPRPVRNRNLHAHALGVVCATIMLAAGAGGAWAQSLTQGVSIKDLKADRDTATGATLITATLENHTGKYITTATATFTLQDAQGKVVGTTTARANDIAPGESRPISATTSLPFTRFTAYDVKAQ